MRISVCRTWLGAATFFGLLPLAFVWEHGRFSFVMLRDQPLAAVASWSLAAITATVYLRSALREGG